MVVMARLLGIPARIANGFSAGHYDEQQKVWIVDGSDAHSWVQIYFPGYGWINFDPTPGFTNTGSTTATPSATPGNTSIATQTPVTTHPTTTPNGQKPGS